MSNQSEGTLVQYEIADEELEWSEVSKLIQVGDFILDMNNEKKRVVEKIFKKMISGKFMVIVLAEG